MKYNFPPKVRKHIYERDNHRCVFCQQTFGLGIAHVFVSRAKGGLGKEENGVLLCARCHHDLDNGKDPFRQRAIERFCKGYLTSRYGDIDIEDLKYKKWRGYSYE